MLVSGFRYSNLGAPSLLAPDSYIIVITMPVGNPDLQSIVNSSEATASEIAYVNSEFDGSSSLAFPNLAFESLFAIDMFGPDFELQSDVAVPEPDSLALFGAGLAGFGYVRCRKAS